MSVKNVGVHIYNGPSVSLPNAAFMIFNFSGGEAEISQAGRQAADTISTRCPLHTSLRDCLNQNGPENGPNL